jgi:cobalt-zinc-cadmium efflux system outer membrane protein
MVKTLLTTVVPRSLCLITLFLALGDPAAAQKPDATEVLDFYAAVPPLELYAKQALDRNPSIQGALARYRAALQRAPQVSALPEPMLSFNQFVRSVETRVGPQVNSLTLSQSFPWFGKLSLREQVALKEAVAEYQMYRARQREIVAQVKRVFYELGFVDQATALVEQEQSLLEHYERLAESRYSAGQGLQQPVIKLQAEITLLVNRRKVLNQQRESLVARLNSLRDLPPTDPVPPVEPLPVPEVHPQLEALYALGEQNREELKASMARVEKAETAVELAKKEYWPNLTFGASMTNIEGREDAAGVAIPPPDNGKNAYSFSVGISIPLWRDKYRAGVLENTETLIAQRKNYLQLRNDIEFAVRDQVVRVETLTEQMDLFERVLIPQTEEALRSAESAYQTGQLGALDLLDSERVLFQQRLAYARFRSDYLTALAEIERAIGTKYPG